MEIKLASGHKIIAELYENGGGIAPEITVYIADENGFAIQDLVLVRAGEENNNAEILVWTDETSEDYTLKFKVDEYYGG